MKYISRYSYSPDRRPGLPIVSLTQLQACAVAMDWPASAMCFSTSADGDVRAPKFHPAPLLLCQIFFLAVFFRRLIPRRGGNFFGSPVAAFFTSPPSSSAISVNVRLVSTEYG